MSCISYKTTKSPEDRVCLFSFYVDSRPFFKEGYQKETWRAFLETPETFRAHFGCHNFLRILKTKTFPGMRFCKKFALSYLEIIVKDQVFRITGSQF